jgi:hypothetical protein
MTKLPISTIAVMQVDFAENFHCTSQDASQQVNYGYKQISVFTAALWHRYDNLKTKVIVSDNISHGKQAGISY